MFTAELEPLLVSKQLLSLLSSNDFVANTALQHSGLCLFCAMRVRTIYQQDEFVWEGSA